MNKKNSPPATGLPSRGALVVALVMSFCATIGVYVGLTILLDLPKIPYNVRELFPGEHRQLSMLVFSALVVWEGALPSLVALLLLRRPRLVWLLPIWVTFASLVSWIALCFAVTWECIQDLGIAGIPGWPQALGTFTRFLALHGGIMLVLVVGHVPVLRAFRTGPREGFKWFGLCCLVALPFWIAARMLTFDWRLASDNLNELIRHDPGHWLLGKPGHWYLSGVLLILGFNGALIASALRRPRTLIIFATVLTTIVLMLPTWYLLNLGLEPNVAKYGKTFHALQFLLGPDRSDLLSPEELRRRWSLVHLAIVGTLACGGLITQILANPPLRLSTVNASDSGKDWIGSITARPASWRYGGVWCACVAASYFLFLVYVHVHPLKTNGISLGEALNRFVNSLINPVANWGPADLVSNVLLFVPFAFVTSGAVTRENARPLSLRSGCLVVAISIAVSLFIEMLQEFIPSRTSSLYDVLAQSMGTGIGMMGWAIFGTAISGRLRSIYQQPNKAFPILYSYVAVLFTFQMLYFDFTISLTQLSRKFRAGRITLIPFTDDGWYSLFSLAYTAGLMIPVGFLALILYQDRKRPLLLALAFGFFVSASIEFAQLFVKSRFTSSTDVVMGCVGTLLGIIIGRTVAGLRQEQVAD